ncbi:hypothetical protein Ddc_12652 [Ditylenchus destructor]|nr:hypothetical protein Ddc_12652 [Ditylenchus destructor]
MNLAILLFLAIATAKFADVTNVPVNESGSAETTPVAPGSHGATPTNASSIVLPTMSTGECPITPEQQAKAQECTSSLVNAAELLQDPNLRAQRKWSSAKICSMTHDGYDCIRKVIVESCGDDKATTVMKNLFQHLNVREELHVTDIKVAECKNLDDFLDSGGVVNKRSRAVTFFPTNIALILTAVTFGLSVGMRY